MWAIVGDGDAVNEIVADIDGFFALAQGDV